MSDTPKVYGCIAAVSAELATVGVSKTRKNVQQGYSFRGIDDIYNALAPLLAKHGLIIVPRIITRDCVERTSKSGAILFFVTVEAEFDFVAVEDGSLVTARTFGEAQDSGDKATNKAMSAAYKYACFQTLCIPTEGDNDADATTVEAVTATAPAAPEHFDVWIEDLTKAAAAGKPALREAWRDSKPALRDYLTATDPARWRALRDTAELVPPKTPEPVSAA